MNRCRAKFGILACGLLALPLTTAIADPTASDLNHGLGVEVDALNDVSTLSWWGVTGETYFIQVTPDLTAGWEYIDYIYPGADDVLAHGFAVNTDAFFYRLKYTDQPTTDPWNDDFDGDDIGNQDELYQDTDPFAFDDLNANGIPDDWESFWDDQFAVFPKPIEAKLTYGQSATKTLYLNNPVAPDADFTVTVTGNEAEFQGAYAWEDSITGSASYSWAEISATGTLLPLVSETDSDSELITLTQFEFPHYGREYTEIWVCSNGYLTLTKEYNDASNEPLPDTSFPDGMIAAFWDDLRTYESGNDSGTIYYQEFADRLIVQYEAVTQDANALTNTFQIVLHADGTIDYFYKELNGVLDTVTVGIHNFDQTQAEQVAYNESYLQNLLAVRFTQGSAYFVEVSPLAGTATQGGFSSLTVDFDTFELEPGTYQADIEIAHKGTGTTPWNIPAILELTNPPSQIELTAPDDGYTMWGDESVTLSAIATDDDFGIDRVEFFADEVKQGEDLYGSYYSDSWQQPTPGVYSVTARAVDRLDTVTTSDPITVTVLEDTDLDRMEDGWEMTLFLGLQEGPLDDFDQDGASNLHEYEAGTDPTDDTNTPENIPSVIAFTDPADGATYLEGDDINFYASFSDADFGAERMVFYADGVEFYTDNSVYSSAYGFWDNPAPGSYTVTAIATDRYGASSTVGTPITVTVLADSDGDRMPDAWETPTFGDLSQEASKDGDGDGFPNIIEYHHGSDGNDPASVPQFATAQSSNSPLTDIGEVRYYRVDGVSNTSFEKSTIQTAINVADDFDIIEVLPNADPADSGIYREALSLSDRVYLFGSSGARSTTIDVAGLNTRALYVSDEAVVSGLTFSGADPSSSYYDGGGLYVSASGDFDRPRFIGCRFLDHKVGDKGGAIYVSNGSPTFISSTIAGNEAASGGAIYNTSTSNIVTLVNTLLWNPDAPDETAGETSSIFWNHSLSRDTTSGNVLIDGADQLTVDPGLGFDYSLVAASPARDSGTTTLHPALDLDGEALSDGLKDIGADEFNDADADGLPDWVEALGATDAASDADGDTLNNLDEYETHWTNPNDADTDSDQLDDGAELTAGTDALDPDTDGDTLPDGWEVNYGLDPLDGSTADGDPDGDTLLTSEEFDLGTNPSSDDTDGDGLKDNVESAIFASTDPSNFYYLDPTNPDTDGDGINDGLDSADGDELSNLDELAIGTDPNLADTDADGVNDSGEVDLGTDPLTNNDFANQDSDNDGLSDLFEINFGTDPNNADTNGNGMNDGEELDNGGDPRVPGPPPEPLNPGDPPAPDPFPPPPPSIYPGSYDILVESKSIAFPKRGHSTFQSTDPAKRYLTLSAQQSFSGGNPESGPEGVSGSKTIEIDPITGDSTTTGDSFVNTGGTPDSPVRRSGESEISGYDDPPNQENDEDATINYSSVLSNENTTAMMVTNGKNEFEDYEDTFSTWSQTPRAYRNVHENELRYDYRKTQFKFKWDAGVEEDQKFPIRYYVLFIPEDDPDTAEKEDQTGIEIVDTIEWDGVGDESPVEEIDPDSLKPGEDGRYRLLQVGMIPDWNRDGSINSLDENKITDTEPHRWWFNDDDDVDETSGNDVSGGGSADHSNAVVDSTRDLVDFFPLHIDIGAYLSYFDDLSTIEVKLKHGGSGLKFVYTDLSASSAGNFVRQSGATTGYGSAFDQAPGDADTVEVTLGGVALSEDFLTKIKNEGKGILLFEGASNSSSLLSQPLVVELKNPNGDSFDIEMPLSLSPVKQMFRHVNLASHTGTSETHPDATGEPANYPDSLCNDKHFAFMHGYNVSQDAAQGWHSEVFKRMHQMGSKAKFIGVTWDGDTSPDYHNAVFRAFQTSAEVANELGSFQNLTIAAHSLGNMVVSNAIAKHGFLPDYYYLLKAATPIESYKSTQNANSSGANMIENMTESDWKDYPDRLFAANWYDLFDHNPNDARGKLTWKDRFSVVKNFGYNFYSEGEDVVENADVNENITGALVDALGNWLSGNGLGRHAWVTQEIAKGGKSIFITEFTLSELHGGWKFNGNQSDLEQVGILKSFPADSESYRPRLASETSDTVPTDEQLAQFGFFTRFNEYGGQRLYAPINDANALPGTTQTQAAASGIAANTENQWHLLAEAIPAMSFAAAANSVEEMQGNIDMEAKQDGWPQDRLNDPDLGSSWLHSDFKNISLNYVHLMYKEMLDIGGLNHE